MLYLTSPLDELELKAGPSGFELDGIKDGKKRFT
jgi:hypothetical protein